MRLRHRMSEDARRQLPPIDRLLDPELVERYGAARVTDAARREVATARAAIDVNGAPDVATLIERMRSRLGVAVSPAINATGVVLHTNLGRAPWGERAIAAAVAASGYATVELDPESGRRGSRGAGAHERLCALTGAEAALVVNNCAAAVMLALAGLARDRQVLVSRGQLVEIGGGFRVPEILEASGAALLEVGTTNRTHLREYRDAITERVAAILWVHHSNFKQVGFTAQPGLKELVELGLPVVADLGSGALQPLRGEPSVDVALQAGASLVCFSGDKLIGGPQAGLIVGQGPVVETLRRHPLARALRPDKVTLAALEATLDDHLLDRELPVKEMMGCELDVLRASVEGWGAALPAGVEWSVVEVEGAVGGGSLPGSTFASVALAIVRPAPERLQDALLAGEPPVVGRIHQGRLLLDARTVVPLGMGPALLARLLEAIRVLRDCSA